MTESALKTHGLTKEDLIKCNAKKWTKTESEKLANFLTEYPDLPIVAHNADYDFGDVLSKAFKNVGTFDKIPKATRWRCTLNLARNKLKLSSYGLDEVLKGCGIKAREANKPHEAEEDAECAAKVYMHMKALPDLKKTELGFCK